MEEDIVKRVRAEEADLVRKLDAVRQLLAAYGEGSKTAPTPKAPAATKATRPSLSSRVDKFGSYGQGVIDKACSFLPDIHSAPMLTRDLLAKLERYGVEVRGENKVNALSALLARSSAVKGHGRAGWTLAGEKSTDDITETLGGNAQNETEAPNGHAASASVVAGSGAPTPSPAAWVNPNPGWTS